MTHCTGFRRREGGVRRIEVPFGRRRVFMTPRAFQHRGYQELGVVNTGSFRAEAPKRSAEPALKLAKSGHFRGYALPRNVFQIVSSSADITT